MMNGEEEFTSIFFFFLIFKFARLSNGGELKRNTFLVELYKMEKSSTDNFRTLSILVMYNW